MHLSLRGAAEQAGTSKTTILRAIKAGRLSAPRNDDGGYDIDPAELLRVYPPDRLVPRSKAQDTAEPPDTQDIEVRLRNATLEAENRLLREQAEGLRSDRDAWRSTCERLLIAAPIVTPAPEPRRSSWRRWWRAG